MLSFKTYLIMEANAKRPSGLGKIKDKSVEQDVEMIAGDVYDLSDSNRYTEKMKYYKGEGNGYITDKEGHVYDVFTRAEQGDAGRIAGGSTHRYVTIKNVRGVDIRFSGYSAVFSSSHGMDIIEDIKNGMYLEDYIAKHWNDLSGYDQQKDEELKKLKDAGDPNAKTYAANKAENKQQKIEDFYTRYIRFSRCNISIENGALNVYNLDQKTGKTRPTNSYNDNWASKEEFEKAYNDWKTIDNQIKAQLSEALVPIISIKLKEYFKMNIEDMNGLMLSLVTNINGKERSWGETVALDTKTNQLVVVTDESGKVNKNAVGSLDLGPIVTLVKKNAGDKLVELFKLASVNWKKLNKKTNWIENNWQSIWDQDKEHAWLYGHNINNPTQAKRAAGEQFLKELKNHSYDESGDKISFNTQFISQYIKDPAPIEAEVEKIDDETIANATKKPQKQEKGRRGENTKFGPEAYAVQEPKMDAWHNGTRRQNVKNCSDAKLKINYEICKRKKYDKEAAELKAEADRRGIVVESLSLHNFVKKFE